MHPKRFKFTLPRGRSTQRYYHLSVSFGLTFLPQFNKVFFPQTQQHTRLSIRFPRSRTCLTSPSNRADRSLLTTQNLHPQQTPSPDQRKYPVPSTLNQPLLDGTTQMHDPQVDVLPTRYQILLQPLSPHKPKSRLRPSTISARIYLT